MTIVRKYLYLLILSAVLLLAAVGILLVADVPRPQRTSSEVVWPEFSVANADGSRWERITIYDAGDGNCYVFLPSYAQLDRVTVTAGKGKTYMLDGISLSEGLNCGSFRLETPYSFSADGELLGDLWFYCSENVAAMYIDTASMDLEELHHYVYSYPEEYVSARVYTDEGKLNHLEDYAVIKCRGYSSGWIDKKSYTLSLNRSTGLLGMGTSEKWVLISDGYDATHLRNKTGYSFAELIAPYPEWVPDSTFAELYINGEYEGLYLLCQKPDAEMDDPNLAAEDYYFEIFPAGRDVKDAMTFDFCASTAVDIKSPKACTEEQLAFLQTRVEELHEVLISEEEFLWQDYIDLDSWARKYLLEELLSNIDGGIASTYFRYDTSEEKFYVGHCWDYDRAFGGLVDDTWNLPNSMLANRDWEGDISWFGGLYRKEAFLDAVKELYVKEYRPLMLENTRNRIPELAQQIRGTIGSEYLRWPELYSGAEWESSVESLQAFLQERITFLDALWLENKTFCKIETNMKNSNLYVTAGLTAEELPRNTCRPDGIWYLEGTDIPFDVTQPVTGNVRLSAFPASETPPPTEEVAEVETAPKRGYSMQDYITFLSIAALGMLLLLFVCVDIYRRRKDRQKAGRTPAGSGTGGGHGN